MTALPVTFSLEPRYKEQFAQFLEDGYSPFVAAMRLWPNDVSLASVVQSTWPTDPYVEAYRETLRDAKKAKTEPAGKAAQIMRITNRLDRLTDDNYLKAERLIAEMSGHIEKAAPPSVNIDNRQQNVERVLIMRDHGDDDAWEAKLVAQQTKLIEGNAL